MTIRCDCSGTLRRAKLTGFDLQPYLGLKARANGVLFRHEVRLIDSAESMARAARSSLESSGALRATGAGGLKCYVTDDARIAEVGARFLGRALSHVAQVDL